MFPGTALLFRKFSISHCYFKICPLSFFHFRLNLKERKTKHDCYKQHNGWIDLILVARMGGAKLPSYWFFTNSTFTVTLDPLILRLLENSYRSIPWVNSIQSQFKVNSTSSQRLMYVQFTYWVRRVKIEYSNQISGYCSNVWTVFSIFEFLIKSLANKTQDNSGTKNDIGMT